MTKNSAMNQHDFAPVTGHSSITSAKPASSPSTRMRYGYCQKRLGIQLAPGNERNDALNKARAACERLPRDFPQSPLVGAAWTGTPSIPKRMCFREHIEWAAGHGALQQVYTYMKSLPESDWHHMGE